MFFVKPEVRKIINIINENNIDVYADVSDSLKRIVINANEEVSLTFSVQIISDMFVPEILSQLTELEIKTPKKRFSFKRNEITQVRKIEAVLFKKAKKFRESEVIPDSNEFLRTVDKFL